MSLNFYASCQKPINQRGFTLIELSIVLVVIGLLIGGILVGRTLINAAEIRGTIAQVEKFRAATQTFRLKYNYLPGDIPEGVAAQFGLNPRTESMWSTFGATGNGLIDTNGGPSRGRSLAYENALYWNDLGTAGLIELRSAYTDVSVAITADAGSVGLYIPAAKLGGGNYFTVWVTGTGGSTIAYNTHNYFRLFAPSSISAGVFQNVGTAGSLTPNQAFQIDSKLDDGAPSTGRIMAAYVAGPTGPSAAVLYPATPAASSVCVTDATGTPYNLAFGEVPSCQLFIRAGF
jgi:prepilin-type N-terminal cleavage/methylation domain-containing protein